MTVLHTFLYDPLVEWKNQKMRSMSKRIISDKTEEGIDINHQVEGNLNMLCVPKVNSS